MPKVSGAHFQSCCRTAAGTAPGHDVHHAHGQGRDAEQDDGADIHLFIDGEQRRDGDQQGGGTGAIQVADESDEDSGKHQQQDIAAHRFQHLVDDAVKHTRIIHHTKEQHGENKQDGGSRHTGNTGLDIFAHISRAEPDQEAYDNRQQNKHDRRCTFAPQQQGNDQDHQDKACDTEQRHNTSSFLQ